MSLNDILEAAGYVKHSNILGLRPRSTWPHIYTGLTAAKSVLAEQPAQAYLDL